MAGYSPASQLTSNLPQSTVIQYDKKFIPNLKAETVHLRCTERRKLEMNGGNQLRLFMYNPLGPNIVQHADGAVGTGKTVSVQFNTTTIGEFADYVNISKLADWTAIDDSLVNIQKELAYQLGQTLSTLVKNTADGWPTIDASANSGNKPANTPFVNTDITTAIQSMLGKNIKPFDRGRNRFCGVIHPFPVGDIYNDRGNNSAVDIRKHTVEGQMELQELPGEDALQVVDWGGVDFYQSTLVTQTSNYASSGKTGLRTYVYGENGVITISLGPTDQIGDGNYRNLKLVIMRATETSISDPEGMIGGWTSYHTMIAFATPPDTIMRGRIIDANTNIS